MLIVPRVSCLVQLSIPSEVSRCSGVLTGAFRCVHLALSGGGPGRSARRPGTEMGLLKSKREKRGWNGPDIPADVKN